MTTIIEEFCSDWGKEFYPGCMPVLSRICSEFTPFFSDFWNFIKMKKNIHLDECFSLSGQTRLREKKKQYY